MIKNFSRLVARRLMAIVYALPTYLHLQLFLTVISWPILLAWGLPLSLASIVGNLIFTPFLMLFLLLSSLIFFCELLYVPSTLFIYPLEWLTSFWTALLTSSDRSWLLICPLPPHLFMCALPLAALFFVHHKNFLSPLKSSLSLLIFLLTSIAFLKVMVHGYEGRLSICCFEKEVTIMQSGGHAVLIDPGCMGRRSSAPSWVNYTLIPFLTKQGITHLDVICSKPSITTFRALIALIDSYHIGNLYLPAATTMQKNTGWSSWQKLLDSAKKYNTNIEKIRRPKILKIGSHSITLDSENKVTKKNNMAYHALLINY